MTNTLFRCSPQAAGGVAQQHGRLELDLVLVAVRDAAPARVRDDDRVGQRAQSVADDGHLHRVARREVPQDAWRGKVNVFRKFAKMSLLRTTMQVCCLFRNFFLGLNQERGDGKIDFASKVT